MRNTKTLRAAASMIAAVTLAASVAGAAHAHESEEHEGETDSLGQQESELNDAVLIAKANGYRLDVALEFAEDSRIFADITMAMSQKYPKTFAAAEFSEDPGDPALIRFKGSVPRPVAEQVRELDFDVKLDGSAKRSAAEMQNYTGRVHDYLLDAEFDQVVTAVTTEQTIEATVFSKAGANLPRLPRDVDIDVSKEPIAEDHHSRGGGNVLNSTNFRICTTGFSVVNNGTYGVSTSGHCDTMDEYQEPDTLIQYDTVAEDSHYGFWGDYQWQSSPTHIDPAEYFARVGEIRDVNSVSGQLPVNTPTCSFGRTTLVRNCDDVYSNFVIATFSGPQHWFLMANDNNFSAPGDSGGPMSWGTEADGLNKGSMTLGGARRQVWVRGDLMPIAIGAEIRTK